jgi:hypothetical protein
LAEATSPAQSLGDSLITPELTPTPPPPPAPTTAQYSTGTLSTLQFVSLNIGFTVNLSSGDVHDGYMSGTGSTVGPFNLSGGTGAVDSTWGTTSVQNFSGTPHLDGSGLTEFTILPYTPGDASVTINDAKVSDPYGADDALQYGELAAADIQ